MTRPLSFQQIKAFRAVVLSGTTVGAAAMLYTTQPSISRLVAQAQAATGLKLFENEKGRLRLTREGQHLFDAVQLYFRELDSIENTVAALRASGAGVFRIASTPAVAQSILPRVLHRFVSSRPNLHYQITTLGSREIYEGLRLGMYDMAITNTKLSGEEFISHEVDTALAVCISAPEHAFSNFEYINASNFNNEVFIGLPEHDELMRRIHDVFEEENVSTSRFMETPFSVTVCALVAENLGVSIMNPYIASQFRDRLCIRPFNPGIPVVTYVVYSRYAPISELAGQFMKDLSQYLSTEARKH